MYIVQEINYTTTGNYRHRKECFLISRAQTGHSPVRQVLTRDQVEKFNSEVGGNLVRLPSVTVTPAQFREYERMIKY